MKEKRNFWLYTMGMLVSFIGSGVQDIALPLFILDLTGSGKAMGTFMIITMVPRIILAPLAGAVGDRVNRKLIMVWMDFGRGCVILILAFLAARSVISIPVLLMAQFFVSIMNTLFVPATIAMLPDIVREEDLLRANSIVDAVANFSDIVGPILGGIIYALGGIQAAFLVNGISFLGSGVSELFITYHQKTRKFEKIQEILFDLKEGINFIRTHRGLSILLLFALMTNTLLAPLFVVLIPYALRVTIKFSAGQYGLLQTAVVVGALIGNIVIATLLAQSKIEKLLKRGFIVQAGVMFIFAVLIFPESIEAFGYASWALFFVMFFTFALRGITGSFVSTPVMVGFQKLIPTELRARVFSFMNVITMGVVPIGYGVMGILLDVASVHMIAITVVILEICVVVVFIFRYLKQVSVEFEHEKKE